MKASRIVAIGLVAAAGLWIFSGYLIPHESESAAAVRPNEVEAKLFRVGIIESSGGLGIDAHLLDDALTSVVNGRIRKVFFRLMRLIMRLDRKLCTKKPARVTPRR